jgi:hypothetical protein
MKRVSLVLALAALAVPAAAAAAQTSQPASPGIGKVKIYGTVKAINGATVTVASATKTRVFVRRTISLAGIHAGARVEAEGFMRNGKLRLSGIHLDDRTAAAPATAATTTTMVDDKGGLTASNDDPPGDDRGGHGQDDAPGHH